MESRYEIDEGEIKTEIMTIQEVRVHSAEK